MPPVASEKQAAQELRNLIEKHQVRFDIPEAVYEETDHASDRVRKMAHCRIINYDMFTTLKEKREFIEVQRLIFGITENLSQGKINDVRNLLNAKKHCCTYFVTFDKKHILSKRSEIKSELGFEVVRPSECLERLQDYLR